MSAIPRKIRLLLVDDHPVVREGLRSCLSRHSHIEVVSEAVHGLEAIQKARELSPDVVLMDINLPYLNGLEATKTLRKELPSVKILVLTVHNQKEYVLQISRSGAHGYLLKDAPPEELLRAIEAVDSGEAFFSSTVAQFVLNDYVESAGKTKSPSPGDLSQREREVLALIAEGYSNKEIARTLGVGLRTAETHRERIMRKLGIRTVAGLTKFAIANQIADL